jgi:hypothetical protein
MFRSPKTQKTQPVAMPKAAMAACLWSSDLLAGHDLDHPELEAGLNGYSRLFSRKLGIPVEGT